MQLGSALPCCAANAPPNQVPKDVPAQPALTGTMYNGNNTAPSRLTLNGPLAPAIHALEQSETAAPANRQLQETPHTLGGNSGNARSGGGG